MKRIILTLVLFTATNSAFAITPPYAMVWRHYEQAEYEKACDLVGKKCGLTAEAVEWLKHPETHAQVDLSGAVVSGDSMIDDVLEYHWEGLSLSKEGEDALNKLKE